MKQRYVWLAAVVFAALSGALALCNNALAGGKAVTLTGTVSVDRDDDDNITAVKLTVGQTEYKVVLCKNGKKLGEDMNEKKVEVTGTVQEKKNEKWLAVKTFKEVKDPDDDDGGEI